METIFKSIELAPKDPILGLNEQYKEDNRKDKINLGIGVYYNESGNIPTLSVVSQVEKELVKISSSRAYLPIDGIQNYNKSVQKLLLGDYQIQYSNQNRIVTVQTLGGTGALKIGSDLLYTILPNSKVYISNPSWENHRTIFEGSGFEVKQYKYYDKNSHNLDFNGMLKDFETLDEHSIVILHACCHNPTGVDPSNTQWKEIANIIKQKKLIPFIDIAYQGFGNNLEDDSAIIRIFAEMDIPILISSSFSKSFALYGERVGALTVLTGNQKESDCLLSQIKRIIRSNYSNPPTHGAKIVSTILNDQILFSKWKDELSIMRNRIKDMRNKLTNKLNEISNKDFSFINKQIGMFSYSGLNKNEVDKLISEYAIYIIGNGRICIAAINDSNITKIANSISQVISK
ncbi:Aromatic-amino-acid aminotransferase [Candidatus Kinetoplastibacterium sorsogonicusi]|uniref:Aminotransferase n=1 Tax=Candidatus Kinetoplastidibacterium kentomonadis TaxID=1576550 RepID=A0A3S7J9K6_9PROT|nr:amino acid aminotransferase [Candidatus Kinetoplastibacterium sorsogonicusi]AWD32357.1 Aromatic-amino-acid aminotransferase [Candidatus Kinetoplastibacterium sorsogonicusi]